MTRKMALRMAAKNKARKTENAVKALMRKKDQLNRDVAKAINFYPDQDRYCYEDGTKLNPEDPRVISLSQRLGRSFR